MNEQIEVSDLKEIGVLYIGDVYELACIILKVNEIEDMETNTKSYHTISGLFKDFAMLASLDTDHVLSVARKHRLSLGAIVVKDKED